MSDLFLLTEAQMRRIEPYFPLSHGVARVDDQRVISRPPFVRPIRRLLGDKGYDADWFRQALAVRGITACIPSKSNRAKPIEHDRILYRERHKIENTFGRLKDWRASTPVTIDAHIPSCLPSASQQPSSSGSDQ